LASRSTESISVHIVFLVGDLDLTGGAVCLLPAGLRSRSHRSRAVAPSWPPGM